MSRRHSSSRRFHSPLGSSTRPSGHQILIYIHRQSSQVPSLSRLPYLSNRATNAAQTNLLAVAHPTPFHSIASHPHPQDDRKSVGMGVRRKKGSQTMLLCFEKKKILYPSPVYGPCSSYMYPTCARPMPCHPSPHVRLVIATVAPADARSCRALTLRVATRGRLLFPEARIGPVLIRLVPAVAVMPPLMFDTRRVVGGGFLVGLASRARLTAVPFLKLVAGGSGSGLFATDGVVMVLFLFRGDSAGLRMVVDCPSCDDCPIGPIDDF